MQTLRQLLVSLRGVHELEVHQLAAQLVLRPMYTGCGQCLLIPHLPSSSALL
jgi:hypothetical protein